jgi:excisionase family DNA binding protein
MVKTLSEKDVDYTVSELAKVLRVSPITITQEIRTGRLRAFHVRGSWRILDSELDRYLDEQTRLALEARFPATSLASRE